MPGSGVRVPHNPLISLAVPSLPVSCADGDKEFRYGELISLVSLLQFGVVRYQIA
jgi:hypothetical protein